MIRKLLIAFVAAAGLAVGAMAEDMQSPQQSGQMGGQTGGQMAGDDAAASQNPDQAFAAALVSHARLQRQISELVAQKATNPQIKQLAQDIAQDYQQLSQRVQQAAEKAGVTVDPNRLLPRDEAILAHMQRLPASALERNYVFYEAGATQTQLLYSQWAAKNAQKPEIKQAAQEIATKLQQRNQAIQQMAQTEVSGGGGAQPGGGRTPSGGQ